MLSVNVDIVVDAFLYVVVAVEVLSLLLTSLHLANITSNTALINCVNPHPTLTCLGNRSLFLTEKKIIASDDRNKQSVVNYQIMYLVSTLAEGARDLAKHKSS